MRPFATGIDVPATTAVAKASLASGFPSRDSSGTENARCDMGTPEPVDRP
jgi:hypothetical protein